MSSSFSWQNSISLCPASFCTPRPNWPVTLGIFWLPTFAFQSPMMKVKSLSRVRLFVTPWTVAYQAPLSIGFSRQECWSRLPFPSTGDFPNPGIKPRSPSLEADSLPSEPPGKTTPPGKHVINAYIYVQAGFRKGRGTRDQIANNCWIIEKTREFLKNIYFCFIEYAKPLTVWITINCGKF